MNFSVYGRNWKITVSRRDLVGAFTALSRGPVPPFLSVSLWKWHVRFRVSPVRQTLQGGSLHDMDCSTNHISHEVIAKSKATKKNTFVLFCIVIHEPFRIQSPVFCTASRMISSTPTALWQSAKELYNGAGESRITFGSRSSPITPCRLREWKMCCIRV